MENKIGYSSSCQIARLSHPYGGPSCGYDVPTGGGDWRSNRAGSNSPGAAAEDSAHLSKVRRFGVHCPRPGGCDILAHRRSPAARPGRETRRHRTGLPLFDEDRLQHRRDHPRQRCSSKRSAVIRSLGLVVNLPPRHLKSLLASVAFPAWCLGRDPGLRLICVSYAQDLAEQQARECRALLSSAWYRRNFPTRLSAAKEPCPTRPPSQCSGAAHRAADPRVESEGASRPSGSARSREASNRRGLSLPAPSSSPLA
jgi:hypothetical protein